MESGKRAWNARFWTMSWYIVDKSRRSGEFASLKKVFHAEVNNIEDLRGEEAFLALEVNVRYNVGFDVVLEFL